MVGDTTPSGLSGAHSDLRITEVHTVPTVAGFYADDQRAIKRGATRDGFAYDGEPVTDGFDRIREAGEALTVELELADGTIATGDCAAVQYSGAGGRDPLFRAADYRPVVEDSVADTLVGRDPARFADNAAEIEALPAERSGGEALHTAVRYGVSQALLDAAATTCGVTKTDVIADAVGADPATEPIPVFGQSGDDRRRNAEKMLVKGVDVLPHGLFNSVETVGAEGKSLLDYLEWLAERTAEVGARHGGTDADEYSPRFHVDVYGVLDELFGPPYDRAAVVDYFERLAAAAAPYPLQVEGPMDAGSRARQIEQMATLRDALADAGMPVDLVADEWCNTLDDVRAFVDAGAADVVQVKTSDLGGIQRSAAAVRYCAGTDVSAYLGGTCNETVTSARACAHVALATDAAQVLAKPGMGFDEGYMVVTNEMRRTIARRRRAESAPAQPPDETTVPTTGDSR